MRFYHMNPHHQIFIKTNEDALEVISWLETLDNKDTVKLGLRGSTGSGGSGGGFSSTGRVSWVIRMLEEFGQDYLYFTIKMLSAELYISTIPTKVTASTPNKENTMNKLNNMGIGEKRVFELNDCTANTLLKGMESATHGIMRASERLETNLDESGKTMFVYYFMQLVNFRTYWKAVRTPTMQYTARPFENRFDDMPETLVIKSVSVSEFTSEFLADMLEKQFLGDAIVMGELSVYEDDFIAEWHNQGNFTHLGTQWVIMARMVK